MHGDSREGSEMTGTGDLLDQHEMSNASPEQVIEEDIPILPAKRSLTNDTRRSTW
jgi:hypothetical protein